MKFNIYDVWFILNQFPLEFRRKFKGIEFIIIQDTLKIDKEGKFISGEYYNGSRQVLLYYACIIDKDDLKKVIIHEIAHHFGLSDKQLKDWNLYQS